MVVLRLKKNQISTNIRNKRFTLIKKVNQNVFSVYILGSLSFSKIIGLFVYKIAAIWMPRILCLLLYRAIFIVYEYENDYRLDIVAHFCTCWSWCVTLPCDCVKITEPKNKYIHTSNCVYWQMQKLHSSIKFDILPLVCKFDQEIKFSYILKLVRLVKYFFYFSWTSFWKNLLPPFKIEGSKKRSRGVCS